jgi:hypothetical protein
MKTRTKREKVGRRLVAINVAHEMAAAVGAGEAERDELVGVALAVGQWLAEAGRPGRWDTVEPAELLEAMAFPAGNQANGFLLTLAGLVGHAALRGDLEVQPTRRILREIEGLAGSPPVAAFAAQIAGQLRALA